MHPYSEVLCTPAPVPLAPVNGSPYTGVQWLDSLLASLPNGIPANSSNPFKPYLDSCVSKTRDYLKSTLRKLKKYNKALKKLSLLKPEEKAKLLPTFPKNFVRRREYPLISEKLMHGIGDLTVSLCIEANISMISDLEMRVKKEAVWAYFGQLIDDTVRKNNIDTRHLSPQIVLSISTALSNLSDLICAAQFEVGAEGDDSDKVLTYELSNLTSIGSLNGHCPKQEREQHCEEKCKAIAKKASSEKTSHSEKTTRPEKFASKQAHSKALSRTDLPLSCGGS